MKKFRKSKQDVIEQERQLAARTSIDAATAQEISLAEQAFIHAARYFEKNIAADEKAKTKNARRLAGFFGVLTFMSIAAVMGLTPLKTVQLGLVRVDNNSGYTDVVWADDKGKPPEQIDDEFWLSTYVRFRESYNFSSHDAEFGMVELMSYGETFTEYRNFQLSSKGYLEVLGTNRQIRTDINNINFLERKDREGTAQVRITKTVLDRNGTPDPQLAPVTWVATVTYDYKNPAKKAGDQWLNPRGFGVRAYTMTQEVGVSNGK
ncbi:type IV secretion system protein (plasmid) [Pseudomonas amygdali pv. lachrymans]|uniref:Bacterial virulence protein VirB8 domain-containing protein n=4 Tax=Pseudomonas syringae group genomosp. 2 TaxID=251698 RepID=A0A3M3UVJ9_PSESG|nr:MULTISPECIES: type IV secretion system protein [Pseudomonas syringae group genomosp. 2]AXH60429.1 conjugal transfer protein [Pseudomonas amygdali pv. lachrymans str. M301315]EFW83008.1 VirB8 [Pseudomonas savastanoi pv. glycinea str. race 4]KPC03446.1 VirB8 [Pseudomonas amygdali pv. lachrymans]KPC21814.1 VirB8 [Pseudomonas amygdali pv. lachrymans]MCQ3007314.1 type IV secretion system protein [Pseudomonas savastanoi]